MSGPLDDATLLDELRDVLEAAEDGLPSQQPSRAQTTVAFHVTENRGETSVPWATLLLDRTPVIVEEGSQSTPEVEIFLSRKDLQDFIHGRLQLPLAIASGGVSFSGPVRKFLRITPVLRVFAQGGRQPAQPVAGWSI